MIKALLKDKNGFEMFQFTQTADYFTGILEEVVSWDEEEEFREFNFLAEVYIKVDGCSHFTFKGERYTDTKEEIDAYYHICGTLGYMNFILAMLFVLKVASKTIENFYWDETMIEKFKPFEKLLDDYIIEINEK